MKIDGDVVIGDLLDKNPEVEDILLELGMHCLGCPASRGETIAEACEVHGIDPDALLAKLNGKS
jgi:hybrid cluster-associated redox disulfide protein